ncbi:chemotaxis protein CheB [Dyella sp. M7H15-1]|uniref:chemotaxis protein CheB n=1 Tax=Dyella sp. M7H15-1 TaxID=2501295 RepID=UPI001004DA57|nr:chemotaxis protein CheB [Dyella sp. M7H15-1]QAU25275.1 chemotaxis protein CheB [Dyella sp. M7H15-1]
MSRSPKRIALFFNDAELGSHLRVVLSEHGAQMAYEGPLSSFDETKLRQVSVDVLVVNLDDTVDDATLERIYGWIESSDIPVVFNDAQASRDLEGWDRARWARHLAAKALNSGAIDPPRPDNARALEARAIPVRKEVVEQHAEPILAEAPVDDIPEPVTESSEEPPLAHDVSSRDSETLAAELEALLSSDEITHAAAAESAWAETSWAETSSPTRTETPSFNINLDHLSLADVDEASKPARIDRATLAQQTPMPTAPEWSFVEEGEAVAATSNTHKPFGVEKVSATDYLAPNVGQEQVEEHELPIEPGTRLELVSLEKAVAPKHEYQPYETHLREWDAAFARLLVLGAARDSQASLSAFLAVLPGSFKLPILLTQHQNTGGAEQLVQSLAMQSALPVKVAAMGVRVRAGEVLVVPRGQQVHVWRDGRVELTAAHDDANEQAPSIDSSFTMAANVFGRDALAILFAGKAADAVAGAQAIHDRGGQVWVESSGSDHHSDMVNGVLTERLASFSGSPQELAVRLIEDFR